MKYTLQILPSASTAIAALPQKLRVRIDERIRRLADEPRPSGFKKLKGTDTALYRVRQGNHRLVYTIEDGVLLVIVVAVSDRKGSYR